MNADAKILVVDDAYEERKLLSYHLKEMGFESVIEARDGQIALKRLADEKVDLIIADWHMSAMDGLEFFKTLQESKNYREIPFLMVTCETTQGMRAVNAGIKNYILKPFETDDFKQKVKELLNTD